MEHIALSDGAVRNSRNKYIACMKVVTCDEENV